MSIKADDNYAKGEGLLHDCWLLNRKGGSKTLSTNVHKCPQVSPMTVDNYEKGRGRCMTVVYQIERGVQRHCPLTSMPVIKCPQ